MKKSVIFCICTAILVGLLSLSVPSVQAAEEVSSAVTSGCHSVDAAFSLSEEGRIVDTAEAVIVYELTSDTMLYSINPDKRVYPTGMVKLMTILVALENAQMSDVVTVSRSDLTHITSKRSDPWLKAGEELTVGDLLYCAMSASFANDASTVLANHIAGSVDAFVQMMNDKAAALGCRDTNFTNVTGLHDNNNYTTARDLCRITEAALENDHFRGVFSAAEYTVSETNKSDARFIQTSNLMMSGKKYQDDRVTGGKAGNTKEGGRCLTVTAKSGDMDVLCIVMGAKATYVDDVTLSAHGSYEECKILLDYAFKTFEYRQVFFEGQVVSQYPVTGGANDVVSQPVDSASTVLPVETDVAQLRWVYLESGESLTAPIEKGHKLGQVQVWYGQKCLAETDLVAMNQVLPAAPPIVPDKIQNHVDSGSWETVLWVIAVLAVLLLLCMLGLLAARAMRNMSRSVRLRRQYRHYRRSRK